jgi:hypothetical protein
MQGLPEYISELVLEKLKEHFSDKRAALNDDNISQYLDLELEQRLNRGLQLTVLNLQWSHQLSAPGLCIVADKCPLLRELDLSYCDKIGNEAIEAIAASCNKLTSLSLVGCKNIGDKVPHPRPPCPAHSRVFALPPLLLQLFD